MQNLKLTDSRNRYIINKNVKTAYELFESKRYKEAFKLFSHNLSLEPQHTESTIGLLLSDIAQDFEEQAVGLYEYYHILQHQNISKAQAQRQILEMIENFDNSTNKIVDMMRHFEHLKADSINGILYEDFKLIIQQKGSFRAAFEDLIFSTKIIFTGKNDLYEFLHLLVDNGYEDVAMEYIQSLERHIAHDRELQKILQKVASENYKKYKQ